MKKTKLDEIIGRTKIVDGFLKWKVAYARSQSHIGIFSRAIQIGLLLCILFEVTGFGKYWVVVVLGLIYILVSVLIGLLDLKYNIYRRETTIKNKHNPEIQEVLKNVRRFTKSESVFFRNSRKR